MGSRASLSTGSASVHNLLHNTHLGEIICDHKYKDLKILFNDQKYKSSLF